MRRRLAVSLCNRGSYEGVERKPFLHLEVHNNSGQGCGPDRDGQDGGPYCIGNLANVPVELIEAENPLAQVDMASAEAAAAVAQTV